MTLVLPRWAAQLLTERAGAERRRVEDVIVEIVERSLAAAPGVVRRAESPPEPS